MRRRNQTQTINIGQPTIPKQKINFNYSDNPKKVIELTYDNYSRWKSNILYLLSIHELDEYVRFEN